jgi:hypothetical protein
MTEPPETFSDEWARFINELRLVLPGVQLLFGFLVTVPFTAKFSTLSLASRHAYFAAFLSATLATAFLVAPAVYHRMHWRRNVRDKERMFRLCNRLAIVGIVLLAVAMIVSMAVLSTMIFEPALAWLLTIAAAGVFGWLWFGLPLFYRERDKQP